MNTDLRKGYILQIEVTHSNIVNFSEMHLKRNEVSAFLF